MLPVLVLWSTLFISQVNAVETVPEVVCQGKWLSLDCPPRFVIEILSANYGRTNENVCNPKKILIKQTNCISVKSKQIIETKCNNKRHCSMMITDSIMGGDPCPGVSKYADVIYRCADNVNPVTKKPVNVRTRIIKTQTGKQNNPTTIASTDTTLVVDKVMQPNETVKTKPIMTKKGGHGFFRSMFILMSLIKDKPKHSMLSVLTGVAAGTVIILVTVLVCVCWTKTKEKQASDKFSDSNRNKSDNAELEKNGLLNGKKERHSSSAQSARSDDHLDSAFGDDELDRGKSNEFEMSNDMAYLDSYLDEYNKNRSLPRPPENSRGSFKMSRRAHNDGSKGRNYHYKTNSDQSFTTFS